VSPKLWDLSASPPTASHPEQQCRPLHGRENVKSHLLYLVSRNDCIRELLFMPVYRDALKSRHAVFCCWYRCDVVILARLLQTSAFLPLGSSNSQLNRGPLCLPLPVTVALMYYNLTKFIVSTSSFLAVCFRAWGIFGNGIQEQVFCGDPNGQRRWQF
jgi:hypothetical protein